MKRSEARELAMKIVYSRLVGGQGDPKEIAEDSGIGEVLTDEELAFAGEIADGVRDKAKELDTIVSEHAIGWSLERIARVDLSILRVALYEMLYREDIPVGASINEAVELAKRFGGDRSYSFINGILGSVARENGLK